MKMKLKLSESLFINESSITPDEPTIDITTVPNIIGVLSGEVDPFADIELNDSSDVPKEEIEDVTGDDEINESVLAESVYDALETGTCFQFQTHPSIYVMAVIPHGKMKVHNNKTGQVEEIEGKLVDFRAFGHPYAEWWRCAYDWLEEMRVSGDIHILSQQEIDNLTSFTDNSKDKFKLPTK